MMVAVRFAYVALVYHRLLSPASQAHWRATREAHVGMDMDALHARYVADRAAWDAAWAAAEEALGGISALLSEEKGGPFFLGEEVSWADFVWGGVLLFFERIGEDVLGELLTRAGEGREVHLRLLEALRGWAGCEED
jgi:glutathione S-transferase